MSIQIQTTADILTIQPNKEKEKSYYFDQNQWQALKTVLQEWDYLGFDLTPDTDRAALHKALLEDLEKKFGKGAKEGLGVHDGCGILVRDGLAEVRKAIDEVFNAKK